MPPTYRVYDHSQPPPLVTSELPPPARTGAFALVRARWLLLWAVVGAGLILGLAWVLDQVTGIVVSHSVLTTLLYLPMVAWVVVMVVRRAGVNLAVLLRWPHLGRLWGVVAGLLVVQLFFSLGAGSLTDLVFPGLSESVDGVGTGNLLMELVAIVLVPPLVEEVLFRGVLVERFTVKWSLRVGIVVSAVLFGILHVDPIGAGMFGVVTAVLYVRTRSLWPGILIHLANNLIVLVAVRSVGSGTATTTELAPGVGETLTVAAFYLLLSVPFLVWFLWAWWPRRGSLSPYQGHELAVGLPQRTFEGVLWSQAPGSFRLTVGATQLALTHSAGSDPVAVLPVEQVHAVYPVAAPGGEAVVVLLRNGSWSTLTLAVPDSGTTRTMMVTISERASAADYRARASNAVIGIGSQSGRFRLS